MSIPSSDLRDLRHSPAADSCPDNDVYLAPLRASCATGRLLESFR